MKIIYSDGSSLGNPGKGGYGVVAIDTDKKLFWEYGGAVKVATNNQMELAACIVALNLVLDSTKRVSESSTKPENEFFLKLDSKYVIQGVTEWSKNWVKNNWKNAQKKNVLNKEMWQEILDLVSQIEARKIKLNWVHVYGHTGEKWNERVDTIARTLAIGEKVNLQKGAPYE